MAKANVTTNFTQKFAIYDLNRFLSTISLFNDPELKFGEKFVNISDGNKMKTDYVYADENAITKVPEKSINLPSIDVTFTLNIQNLNEVEKAAGVLQLPEICVSGDGTNIYLKAVDSKNPSGDVFSIQIGETNKIFNAYFKYENIKIIPGDYEVNICSRGISHFSGKEAEYWIAVEQNSTF
jgi:hypothetical protein